MLPGICNCGAADCRKPRRVRRGGFWRRKRRCFWKKCRGREFTWSAGTGGRGDWTELDVYGSAGGDLPGAARDEAACDSITWSSLRPAEARPLLVSNRLSKPISTTDERGRPDCARYGSVQG